MDLRRLRSMVAIADQGGVTAAAEALALSHSAVSGHVKELEAEIGALLLDRATRPPTLTEAGAALVFHGRRMLAVAEEIAALGQAPDAAGALAVGVVPSAVAALAAPALAAVRAGRPRLRLRLRAGPSDALAAMVTAGELDVALTTAPPPGQAGLEAEEVARQRIVAVAPAGGAAGAAGADATALLTGRPFVWFNRRAWAGRLIETRLAEMGVALDGDLEVDSLHAAADLVRAGVGVTAAPEGLGAPLAGLRTAPLGAPPLTRGLALLRRPGAPANPAAAAFAAAVRAAVSAAVVPADAAP